MNGTVVGSGRLSLAPGVTVLLVTAALFGISPAASWAQAPETDSVPRYNLDALTVTVLGTPVRLGASPYPVSVVGATELREGKNGMFLEDALESLPGVQVQNRFNYAVGERISIRGFGARAQFGVQGIHVLVDGVPATLPDGQSTLDHVDIGILGRVEALRGPASSLYGNAAGGVLRFETQIPARVGAREEATIVGGSDGLLRLQTTTSGTVGSTGYLLSVNKLSFDGFRHDQDGNPYGAADRLHVNARLVQPVAGGELGVSFNFADLDSENPGSLREDLFEADYHQVWTTYTNFQTGKEVQQGQLGVTWQGPVGPLTADAAVYGLSRDFVNPLPGDIVDLDRQAQGARLSLGHSSTSGNVGIEVLGGADIDVQDDDRREFASTFGTGMPGDITQNQNENVRGVGVFMQSSLSMNDRVSVIGGIRYDRTRFKVTDFFPVIDPTPPDDPGNPEDSGARTMDAVSPSIGVHVQAIPEIGIFANFSKAFETPSTVQLGNRATASGGFNPDLDPQTSNTVEVGARGTVQERISYELTFFNTKLKNELIAFENPDELTYYRNAGESSRTGMEALLRAQLHEFVAGQVSYARVDAEFDDYVLNPGQANEEVFSGNKVPGLSPNQVQGSLRLGPAEWYAEFAVEYVDEVQVTDANDAAPADAYTLFDIRVGGAALPLGAIELSPFAGVQNLTDEKYVSSVAINAFGSRFYEPGPGRSFYVGGTLAFSR